VTQWKRAEIDFASKEQILLERYEGRDSECSVEVLQSFDIRLCLIWSRVSGICHRIFDFSVWDVGVWPFAEPEPCFAGMRLPFAGDAHL